MNSTELIIKGYYLLSPNDLSEVVKYATVMHKFSFSLPRKDAKKGSISLY